jgi:hypothetical protein
MMRMFRALFRRFFGWWLRLFSPHARIVAVPGVDCAHASPEALAHRLKLVRRDQAKVAEILASTANCAGCMCALALQLIDESNGRALDSQADADDEPAELSCVCKNRVNSEVVALRLCISLDGDSNGQDQAIALALADVWDCRACLIDALVAEARTTVCLLNDTHASVWRPVIQKRLFAMLDAEQGGE